MHAHCFMRKFLNERSMKELDLDVEALKNAFIIPHFLWPENIFGWNKIRKIRLKTVLRCCDDSFWIPTMLFECWAYSYKIGNVWRICARRIFMMTRINNQIDPKERNSKLICDRFYILLKIASFFTRDTKRQARNSRRRRPIKQIEFENRTDCR